MYIHICLIESSSIYMSIHMQWVWCMCERKQNVFSDWIDGAAKLLNSTTHNRYAHTEIHRQLLIHTYNIGILYWRMNVLLFLILGRLALLNSRIIIRQFETCKCSRLFVYCFWYGLYARGTRWWYSEYDKRRNARPWEERTNARRLTSREKQRIKKKKPHTICITKNVKRMNMKRTENKKSAHTFTVVRNILPFVRLEHSTDSWNRHILRERNEQPNSKKMSATVGQVTNSGH